MSWDHPNYSIVENKQNTEKSPGDQKRLAVSQSPVKDCGDLGINKKTPNRMLTCRLPYTKCLNTLLRIVSTHPSG